MSLGRGHEKPIYTVGGTPIRGHGLGPDRFSMIVPDGILGLDRKSASPSRQANKRRRLNRNDYESSADPEDLQSPTSWTRVTLASTHGSDSEMTEFEEESSGGSVSADTSCGLHIAKHQSEMRGNDNDPESRTPEASARKTQDTSMPSPLQNACAFRDKAPKPKVPPVQTNRTSTEMRTGDDKGCAVTPVANL